MHFLKRPESEERLYDEMNKLDDEDAASDDIIDDLQQKMTVTEPNSNTELDNLLDDLIKDEIE